MSARDELIEIVTRDPQSSGGDPIWATDLVDAHRAEVLAEARATAAAEQLVDGTDDPSDRAYNQAVDDVVDALTKLAGADAHDATPLIVARFDTAMEPAPEEEPVLTIGCIAEDGRPVALLLDVEDRRKVGGWLVPEEEANPDFFAPGCTYTEDAPFRAPEDRANFQCIAVATHPTTGSRRALGFEQSGVGAPWASSSMRDEEWWDGWVDAAEAGDGS